jgi:hypothetical protein
MWLHAMLQAIADHPRSFFLLSLTVIVITEWLSKREEKEK